MRSLAVLTTTLLALAPAAVLSAAVRPTRSIPSNEAPARDHGRPLPTDASFPNSTINEANDDFTFLGYSAEDLAAHFATEDELQSIGEILQTGLEGSSGGSCSGQETINIDVYFRIYYHGEQTWENGYKTREQLVRAVERMNADFVSTNSSNPRFRFTLAPGDDEDGGIFYRRFDSESAFTRQYLDPGNARTFRLAAAEIGDENRGSRLSRPDSAVRDLYVYSIGNLADSRGAAGRPTSITRSYSPPSYDGIFMQWDYLAQDEPQTEEERLRDKYYLTYSPDTLAHEAGHWLGLSHTHEGGCSGTGAFRGDLIADTIPWSASVTPSYREQVYTSCEYYSVENSGSATSYPFEEDNIRDICGTTTDRETIKAAIANRMSYSKPNCRTLYTSGQYSRMYQAATVARGFVPACSS